MDNDNKDNVQNMDNEGANVVTDCLCNSVIVRTILEHFSSPELRLLSFVNKIWKTEARSVLRKRGHLTAYVKGHDLNPRHPREEVEDFISDLKQMNSVPFSGISIDVCFEPGFRPSSILPLDPLEGVTLDQPLLKTLSVILRGSWLKNMTSPAFLLIKKVLQDCSIVLEELSLNGDFDRKNFIEKVVQDISFPRLKILKLEQIYNRSVQVGDENYMKTMLARAPNLKVLHSDWPINFMLNVLNGRSVVPVHTRPVVAPFDGISENTIKAIKLENIQLKYARPEFNLERFNRIAPLILQLACTTTLRSVWIDPVLALPLMNYGISMENVKYLRMDLDYSQLEHGQHRILNIVKNFNFTRIFPKLNRVEIAAPIFHNQIPANHMHEIIAQANAVRTEPTPDRAANVKTLYLKQYVLSREAAQFFADMFPNVEKLDIDHGRPEEIAFGSTFERWGDLKELEVRGNMLPTDENLDSVFCGIFPEEVAELRLKDEEYLARVNIVPVMPALNNLKNLRTLYLNHLDCRFTPFDDDATFVFSKVTALLAFARHPDLAVRLTVSYLKSFLACPVMTHLEPYVSITCDDLDDDECDD